MKQRVRAPLRRMAHESISGPGETMARILSLRRQYEEALFFIARRTFAPMEH